MELTDIKLPDFAEELMKETGTVLVTLGHLIRDNADNPFQAIDLSGRLENIQTAIAITLSTVADQVTFEVMRELNDKYAAMSDKVTFMVESVLEIEKITE